LTSTASGSGGSVSPLPATNGCGAVPRDDQPVVEEPVRQRDALGEQPAAVVAQIDDEGLQPLPAQALDLGVEEIHHLDEVRDPDVADAVLDHPAAHRFRPDDAPRHGQRERLLVAADRERHRRAGRPADPRDGVRHGESLERVAVRFEKQIVFPQPGGGGGTSLHGL
jgi:hypothetical protein